jgi:GNAT superfamily N-acetyltransferase
VDDSETDSEIAALERRAFAAWPAEEVHPIGAWRLRHTRGVTRRANSVWPDGEGDLPALIDAAERFYADRGQPALFQVTPLAPPALDPLLAARGYQREAPVAIQIAGVPLAAPEIPVRTETALFEPWLAVAASGRFAAVTEVFRGLLTRIGPGALFALAGSAAVGLGVIEGRWMGIFNMLTVPGHRRRGLGRAVLAALAAAGRACGVERLYLQVERDNPPALALYRAAGFREIYGYHYRVKRHAYPGAVAALAGGARPR